MAVRRLTLLAVAQAAAAAGLIALAGLAAARLILDGRSPGPLEAATVGAVLLGLAGVVTTLQLLRQHFRRLERLRGAIVTVAGDPAAVLPFHMAEADGPELGQVWDALGELAAREARTAALPDDRLRAVLGAIAEAIVVITDSGRVSLVNFPAKQLLGEERVQVGTSVFAALHRHPVLAALRESAQRGSPVDATLPRIDDVELAARVAALPEHGGAVLSFPGSEVAEHRHEIEAALELHDVPPPAGPIATDTPLDALPALVVDIEATSLDVGQARVVAIGAVRLHGPRVYRGVILDRLVRPDVPIPPAATAVHGITDDMVAEARTFPEAFAELAAMTDGLAILGHNIGFDLAVLEAECRRHDLTWTRPPALDTFLLAGALLPEQASLRLEALAEIFGVAIEGRHTALGDCLVAAQVFQRMRPLLHDRGITTLGQAQALADSRKDLVKAQRESGW